MDQSIVKGRRSEVRVTKSIKILPSLVERSRSRMDRLKLSFSAYISYLVEKDNGVASE
jgi:hypothetical protein